MESYSNVVRSENSFDVLPSSERLLSGGAESNRGFKLSDLGPVVRYTDRNNESQEVRIRGTQAVAIALELRYKLAESAGLSFFIDSSNTFLTDREKSAFPTSSRCGNR